MTAHKAVGADGQDDARFYPDIDELGNDDPSCKALIERAKRLIDRRLPVLILGESGTGKECLARALHAYSQRRNAALVTLNCAAIPENLIESELYGYARGAFSGALSAGMKGRLMQAHKGTLFLDEIGDMPASQQMRFLRVLSEKEVAPLGASAPVRVDFQLICATHQDLFARVEGGTFREDLYYRIAVGIVSLPPLRERGDRALLINKILGEELGAAAATVALADNVVDLLMTHRWPGNVRQLSAALRYACAVRTGDRIEVGDLPLDLLTMRSSGRHEQPRVVEATQIVTRNRHQERERIMAALVERRWNISAAARDLGVCRASVYRKLKELRIPHVRDGIAGQADEPAPMHLAAVA
ncbi:sigma 54-interacting transcriptional regulator [Robbsia sp. Bb-Pol-6]|uniref:Sigma 54-interacting transcriptional regulator n=1 Tax=Robbsia betulipollinis TaxID=2981849 RepID=A0ABT3ZR64_9BURK|nr:sigma 54-interacting transcriptional regulator [Robbsia betulipollinis]MCY0388977.1 sigma 54-interacting transcriptional regulator [Robbsia betulipollinis]